MLSGKASARSVINRGVLLALPLACACLQAAIMKAKGCDGDAGMMAKLSTDKPLTFMIPKLIALIILVVMVITFN